MGLNDKIFQCSSLILKVCKNLRKLYFNIDIVNIVLVLSLFFTLVPRALFRFPLIAKICAGDEVDYFCFQSYIILYQLEM